MNKTTVVIWLLIFFLITAMFSVVFTIIPPKFDYVGYHYLNNKEWKCTKSTPVKTMELQRDKLVHNTIQRCDQYERL